MRVLRRTIYYNGMLATIDYFDTLLADDEADYQVIVTRNVQYFIKHVKKQELQALFYFVYYYLYLKFFYILYQYKMQNILENVKEMMVY